MHRPLGSIVIPAYNEGRAIGQCLDSIFAEFDPAEVDVVVVCNGCTDDTAARVRDSKYPVTLIELSIASKIEALRAGERAVTTLPRVFMDADVSVGGPTVRQIIEAAGSDAVAARPPISFDVERCSRLVRRYYAAREHLPGVMNDLCAAGVYALSATARSRFGAFPNVIADDLFAARIVDPDEITIVESEPVVVHVPRTSRALLGTLKRIYRGNRELARDHADVARPTTRSTSRDLLELGRRRGHHVDALTYIGFALAARVALRLDRKPTSWERDETTRQEPSASRRAQRRQ